MALLQAGGIPGGMGVPADTSIQQTGLVPFGANSLQFDAEPFLANIGTSGLLITLNVNH